MLPWWIGFVALALLPAVWIGVAVWCIIAAVQELRQDAPDGAETR